jgi:uncharacterized membrane protein YccC
MLKWLGEHDRGFAATRRAARAAIVMPAMFAFAKVVIGDATVAMFAAFGSFAMLLLVDFAGPMRARLQAQVALALACGVLIAIATLCSRSTVAAVAGMTVVAFGVLFAGVVSSVLAGATTAMLLAFILPVTLPGDVASIPERLAGWGLASLASLPAIALLWPAPVQDPVRGAAIAAMRALANRLRTGQPADEEVAALRQVFFATPYRPTGLSTAARSVIRLVDELKWLNDVTFGDVRGEAAAEVLERSAELLEDPRRSPEALHAAQEALAERLAAVERPAGVSALDPGFRKQEVGYVVAQVARNADIAAAADRRPWLQQLLGRRPAGLIGPLAAAQERAGAHVQLNSQWLRNSVRGAIALGLAVLVADLAELQHSFWVVLGTLSVLRSNALSTGQGVVGGLAGTAAGFVVGGAIVALVGTNTTVLWLLLPLAILVAGLAPAAVSFAAGQAAFTVTLLILFNILVPQGWRVGLVRIEDVAIGGAVSLAVGVLFWPRGAAAALRDALADAYADSARYLAATVRYGVDGASPGGEAMVAAAAARRLDDTFRGYLAERGEKRLPLAEVTGLVSGVVGLRLAGDAVLDLWKADGAAGRCSPELLRASDALASWYGDFAASLRGGGTVPAPLDSLPAVDGDERVIWTGDHLDAARRLQETLVIPASAVSESRRAAKTREPAVA